MDLRVKMQIDLQLLSCTRFSLSAYVFMCLFHSLFIAHSLQLAHFFVVFSMAPSCSYLLFEWRMRTCTFLCQSNSEICARENKICFNAYKMLFLLLLLLLLLLLQLHRIKSCLLIFSLHLFTYLFISCVGYVVSGAAAADATATFTFLDVAADVSICVSFPRDILLTISTLYRHLRLVKEYDCPHNTRERSCLTFFLLLWLFLSFI